MSGQIVSAADLIGQTFPEQRWAVPGIVPEGLTILAARPKIGKSWLVLGIGVAIASGGRALGMVPCEAGDVLYLALEDTPRRLQDRLVRMLSDPALAPSRLHLVTEWPRFDAGGLEELEEWLIAHPDARLVIIDTLGKVRPRRQRNANLYDEDYAAGTAMKQLADRYGVAFLVNHHTSQARAEDVFDTVSGTLATTGAADAVMVIQRTRGVADATLDITGRDVEEARYALRWNASVASWTILDLPAPDISAERLAVLSYVRANPGATPSVTASGLGNGSGNANAMRKLMWTMARAGLLTGDATHGYYATVTRNAGNGGNDGNDGNGGMPDES